MTNFEENDDADCCVVLESKICGISPKQGNALTLRRHSSRYKAAQWPVAFVRGG